MYIQLLSYILLGFFLYFLHNIIPIDCLMFWCFLLQNGYNTYHPTADTSLRQLTLPKPDGCPKEIYDLMVECWQRSENSRPNFREICLFLQRKNLGFQIPQSPT